MITLIIDNRIYIPVDRTDIYGRNGGRSSRQRNIFHCYSDRGEVQDEICELGDLCPRICKTVKIGNGQANSANSVLTLTNPCVNKIELVCAVGLRKYFDIDISYDSSFEDTDEDIDLGE